MRILIDMNLPPAWVPFLIAAGFEAIHWSSVGAGDASDRQIMEWAAGEDYVVMTNDLDFSAILAVTQQRSPSVLQIRSARRGPAWIGHIVLQALAQTTQDLIEGALVSVDETRTRVRILPLRR